jgi:hypothetical protein
MILLVANPNLERHKSNMSLILHSRRVSVIAEDVLFMSR